MEVGGHVEGAVERDVAAVGELHELGHQVSVDRALFGEGAHHEAVRSELRGQPRVTTKDGTLVGVEDEPAAAGPHHHVHGNARCGGELEHGLDRARRGRRPALRVVLAQLDPVGAALERPTSGAHAGGQNLDPPRTGRAGRRVGLTHADSIGQTVRSCAFIWLLTMPATS